MDNTFIRRMFVLTNNNNKTTAMKNNTTAAETKYFITLTTRGFVFRVTENKGLFADFGLYFINDKALEEKCRKYENTKEAVSFTDTELDYLLTNKFNKTKK